MLLSLSLVLLLLPLLQTVVAVAMAAAGENVAFCCPHDGVVVVGSGDGHNEVLEGELACTMVVG